MPHAVITNASTCPDFTNTLLAREGSTIHKVLETWTHEGGWVLKSLITGGGPPMRLLVRIDKRDDGLVVHLEDHLHVERTPDVFQHLAHIAVRVLAANPGSSVGKTNLQNELAKAQDMAAPAA